MVPFIKALRCFPNSVLTHLPFTCLQWFPSSDYLGDIKETSGEENGQPISFVSS